VIGDADRAKPLRDYCVGLMMPCERKSVEPMAAITAPERTAAQHQSLLHFVGEGNWSDEKVLAKVRELVLPEMERHGPIEAWIIDDTGFPKKGRHSVGVGRQYCGELAVDFRRIGIFGIAPLRTGGSSVAVTDGAETLDEASFFAVRCFFTRSRVAVFVSSMVFLPQAISNNSCARDLPRFGQNRSRNAVKPPASQASFACTSNLPMAILCCSPLRLHWTSFS
jgi:hypothetical protein